MQTRFDTQDSPHIHSELFCYFVGIISDMATITHIESNAKTHQVHLSLPDRNQYQQSPYIQLNGILFQVTSTESGHLKASTTFELFNNMATSDFIINGKVNIGVLAQWEDPEFHRYLVEPTASKTARVLACGLLSGHHYKLKIDFVCDESIPLQDNKHLGLNGSVLLAREVTRKSGLQYFSIYAGRSTREKTKFNADIEIGSSVNITLPHEPEPLTIPYPTQYRGPS